MSEQKESSVLFSLKELMSLEEDRIKQEEDAKAAAVAAEAQAKASAERRARDDEEARIRAEEERRREDERRSREETARLEALRQAEVEKARVEVEQRARLEAMSAQQEHERKLAALNQDESKKKLRKTLYAVVAGVLVIGGVTTGVLIKKSQDDERARQALEQQARQAEDDKKAAEKQAKDQQAKIEGLLSQLSSAQDEATRAKLQKQLEDGKTRLRLLSSPAGALGRGRPSGHRVQRPLFNLLRSRHDGIFARHGLSLSCGIARSGQRFICRQSHGGIQGLGPLRRRNRHLLPRRAHRPFEHSVLV